MVLTGVATPVIVFGAAHRRLGGCGIAMVYLVNYKRVK